MSNHAAPPSRTLVRRAMLAGLVGTLIEAYDFAVYAYLVVYTAPLFFPADDPAAGVLASLLVLAAGFVARPLGGIFFGRMGDRLGRRHTLVITVTTMGAATFLMGVLPTYEQVGTLAPILLVVSRLVQGFSAGGELMGSATYVAEYSSPKTRGVFNAITPLGFSIGNGIAPAVVGLTTLFIAADQMAAWGWRIPLLLSLPLTALCLIYRLRLEDSPAFKAIAERREVTSSPVMEVVRGHWPALLRVIALALTIGLVSYTVVAYLPIYLQTQVGVAPGTTSFVTAVAIFCALPFLLASGFAVDRYGRRVVMATLLAAMAVAAFPVMLVMSTVGSSVLAVGVALWFLVALSQAISPPVYAAITGLFPTRVRYTGAAVGFTLGSVVGGGFGPYFAAQLTTATGSPYAPALLIAGAAVLGIAVILTAPTTNAGDEADPDTAGTVPPTPDTTAGRT